MFQRLEDPTTRRLATLLGLLALLFCFGTAGYSLVEGWSLADGVYMTAITISTVGYGETNTLGPNGRAFTTVLIFMCVVLMTYLTATLTSFIVEGDLNGRYIRRKMLKMIEKFKGHVIVCGADQLAQVVIERLNKKRKKIVVVDEDEAELQKIKKRFRKVQYVVGKATSEMSLAEANVLNASTIVAAMESDVDNLLLTIACRDLGTDISVIARADDSTIANSMRKARVDEVVSPNLICGDHMAEMASELSKVPTPTEAQPAAV